MLPFSAMSAEPGSTTAAPSPQWNRPWLFGFLVAPVAVLSNGIIGGVLSYLLRDQGVNPARVASIVALLNLPQTIYFAWSPLTDFWMRRRTWLLVAATAAGIVMYIAFRQASLATKLSIALIFVSACLGQLIVSSCGGMMGTIQLEVNRRRASSFYQGGSLAFGALALFVLAYYSGRLSLSVLGLLAGVLIALPSLFVLAAPKQDVITERGIGETFARIGREIQGTFFRWEAIPYALVMIFPMGSGAMFELLPELAADYHISGQQVAWINGIGGALLTAAGALAATLVPARVRAPIAYLSVCLVNEATLAVLWLGPLRPSVYFVGTTLFLFTVGAAYALFTAVVLEYMGDSGKSGSARYSIVNSLGNIPVVYMAKVDGIGYAHWGAHGMPGIDVVLGSIGGLILLTYFLTHRKPAVVQGL